MNYYGYIKENGTTPEDNVWKSSRELTLTDDSVVLGYEGGQSESDENVEIIGTSQEFQEWAKENLKNDNI